MRLRTEALSHYLQKPLVPTLINTEQVLHYVTHAEDGVNSLLEKCFVVANKALAAGFALENIGKVQGIGLALELTIQRTLNQLGPLVAL
jgi:hypothetical protein